MKKILSFLLLIFFTFNILNINISNVSADEWNKEMAEHLANKTLYYVDQEIINQLYNAWSKENAIDILFPSKQWQNRDDYNNQLNNILNDEDFSITNWNDMKKYYIAKRYLDPYQAKSKFFNIIEDTFSVSTSSSKDITYIDIENTHDMLYDLSFSSYKDIIKRNLYNNGDQWDYSLSKFLDLLNQSNPKYPNENYWRELLQLFLMLEYIPTESEDNWDKRNYSEEDVNAISKILFWFKSDENTHEIIYDNNANTNTTVTFLDWDLKQWDSFPFYNESTWEIDIQELKNPINWNNWLADNIVDYIFSKREYEISMFLADKIYRFYIAENPEKQELEQLSNIIINNNFDLYYSLKEILKLDLLYSEKSLNSIIYKNPLDLTISTNKLFWINAENIRIYNLINLWWEPYWISSIFGRDWFDKNEAFFTAYTQTQWVSESSYIVNDMDLDSFLWENTISSTWAIVEYTANNLIDTLENKIYNWSKLKNYTKEKLLNFLSKDKDWNDIEFQFNDNNYRNYYIKWLIHLMLIQPEYLLASWYNLEEQNKNNENNNFINNDSKLVIIKANWGFDYLSWVIPKDEYSTYLEYRWSWALVWNEIISLNEDYYINSALAPFKELFDSWDLKIINRVWTPEHSRWHDTASQKITSLNNTYDIEDYWIVWNFIKNEDYSKTIVLWWYKPLIFRWWNYLNIWSNAYFYIRDNTNNDFRDYKKQYISDLLNSREYPSSSWDVFKNAVTINNVAIDSYNNWWRAGSWYNMEDNFTFLESIFDSNISNIARMWADWGYDTHWNQKNTIENNLTRVAQRTYDYYNRVKDKQDVTIVIFSEFWRTNKINSSNWTDHWQWGWMFIISNNKNVKNELKEKIYWNLSFINSKDNWLWVWIDYRAVYSSLMNLLYNQDISSDLKWVFKIQDYIDNAWPKVELLRREFENINNSSSRINFVFDINDTNFKTKEASYLKINYWTDPDNMYEESQWRISRYMGISDDKINVYLNNINSKLKYYYKITLYDNQYNETILEWSFISPEVIRDSSELSIQSDTRLTKYNNTSINWSLVLEDPILLWSNDSISNIEWENDIKMLTSTWTYINSLTSSSTGVVWNWGFVLPKEINKVYFLKDWTKIWNNDISNINIEKLIKVWADKLWVWMSLNKDVEIQVPINQNKNYVVYSSENWINWQKHNSNNVVKNNWLLSIKTNHFSYYALIEADSNWNIIDNSILEENSDEVENTSKKFSSWWRSVILRKDSCEFWDFSPSYYDRDCWIDPEKELATMSYTDSMQYQTIDKKEESRIQIEKENLDKDLSKDIEEELINEEKNNSETIKIWDKYFEYEDKWDYILLKLDNEKYYNIYLKIIDFIIKKKFDNNTTNSLIEKLNNLMWNIIIYKTKNIDLETKNKSKIAIIENADAFNKIYKKAVLDKKIRNIYYKKEIKTEESNNVVETKENINDMVDNNDKINLSYYQYYVESDSVLLMKDAYWKESIWFLEKWDIVEQTTQLHEKWFFQIKVIKSKNLENWTIWYIFKKHLTK